MCAVDFFRERFDKGHKLQEPIPSELALWKLALALTALSSLILMPALGFNPINAVMRQVNFDPGSLNPGIPNIGDVFDGGDEGSQPGTGGTGSGGDRVVPIDYSRTGIIYPLFGLPGQTWDDMIEYRKAHPSLPWIAVINPLNGPGGRNYVFEAYVDKMQDANIQVLGYVSTYWSAVRLETVKDDIDKYKEYFGVDGIFLDEMSNHAEDVEHYRAITDYAKSVGMTYVIGNTGTDAAQEYVGVVDNIVISEGYGEPTLSRLAGWHVPYGRENFSYIAYNRNTVDPQYVVTSTHFASYVYITDDYLPNPYDKMPSHFDVLLAQLDPDGKNDMRNVVVKSVDLAGAPVNATLGISEGSQIVASGGGWVTYVGRSGNTYEVSALNTREYAFSHWEDGSTSPTRTVSITTSSMVLTAFYREVGTQTEPGITINAITHSGSSLSMWAVIESGGRTVETGFTPLRFSGEPEQQYSVHLSDWQYRTFDKWNDDGRSNPHTFTYTGESYLAAYYKYESPTEAHDTLTINTYDDEGRIITMWTTVRSGDSALTEGYTPLSVPVTRGQTYTVSVADWENVVFDRWEDGSQSRRINITIDEAHESLTAYYVPGTAQQQDIREIDAPTQ